LFISIVIPLVVSIMLGISLLTKRCYFTIQKSVTLVVFWIVASVLATVTITLQAERVIQQFGPINGRADDSGFEVEWKNGIISVDEQNDQLMFEEKGVDPTGSTTRTTRYRHNN
jgi:hypothetical protein